MNLQGIVAKRKFDPHLLDNVKWYTRSGIQLAVGRARGIIRAGTFQRSQLALFERLCIRMWSAGRSATALTSRPLLSFNAPPELRCSVLVVAFLAGEFSIALWNSVATWSGSLQVSATKVFLVFLPVASRG